MVGHESHSHSDEETGGEDERDGEGRALCTSKSRTNTWGWMKKRGVTQKKKKRIGRGGRKGGGGGEGGGEIERCGYFIIQSRIRDKLGSDRSQHIGCEFQIMCCLSVSPLLSSPLLLPHLNTPHQLSPPYLSLSFFLFFSFLATAPLFPHWRLDWVLVPGQSAAVQKKTKKHLYWNI